MTESLKKNPELLSGLLLLAATFLALLFANQSYLAEIYLKLKNLNFTIGFTDIHWALTKPLLLWINDGLMAIFFLLIGLELKREILVGHLSNPRQILLPALAALGGVIVPALIYAAFNAQNSLTSHGWAIPVATDIAFALGILALLSRHIPKSLRIFLLALAIFDDLAAILIIAIFYTAELSFISLFISLCCVLILIFLNMMGVRRISVYILIGLVMWLSLLKSGVHATISGVVLGLIIPYAANKKEDGSPLEILEHSLKPWTAFLILPLFAFVNAGVNLQNVTWNSLLDPVTLGIALGLFLGKQIGVMSFAFLSIYLGFAKLPADATWKQFYGVAVLCGIGFTMSLFIASLSFDLTIMMNWDHDRLGILLGSFLSGLIGYLILRKKSS